MTQNKQLYIADIAPRLYKCENFEKVKFVNFLSLAPTKCHVYSNWHYAFKTRSHENLRIHSNLNNVSQIFLYEYIEVRS